MELLAIAAPAKSRVQAGRTQTGYLVRIEGRGVVHDSLAIREFATLCLQDDIRELCVDLSSCIYLDSTCLGCLVELMRRCKSQPNCDFRIVADAEKRASLLRPSRLDSFFTYLDNAPPIIGPAEELSIAETDLRALGQHVIECHHHLAAIPGPEQQRFAQLTKDLSRELEAR